MRNAVSFGVLGALLLLSGSARADSVCCHGWLGLDYATCKVTAPPCVAGDTQVEVDVVGDGGAVVCAVGSTTCAVLPEWTCCREDCAASAQCTNLDYKPTCCEGMCLETIAPGGTSVTVNMQCTDTPPMVSIDGCCYPTRIELPTSIEGAPGEWSVGTGDPVVADAGADAQDAIQVPQLKVDDGSDAAPVAPSQGDQLGGCSISGPARDSLSWSLVFGTWAVVQLRRRR